MEASSSSFFAIGMEATGSTDGGRGPSWSYSRRHEEIESSSYTISSSSRSGTIVSSTYTSGTSRSSRLSTGISMEAAALELDLESELRLVTPEPDEKDAEHGQAIKKLRKEIDETTLKETRMKHIEKLVQDFFRGPSENCSILGGSGGGMSALERWFSELGVSWVLQLDVAASALMPLKASNMMWIQALTQIMETIHLTESFYPDHGHGFAGIPGISEEEEVESGKLATTCLDPLQFALFFQETMAKMLVFVDVMFSRVIYIQKRLEPEGTFSTCLNSCLKVNRALSEVLLGIKLQFHSSDPAEIEIEKIEKEMVSLLSAKQSKAFDAIWSFVEERKTRALKSMEDSLGAETAQGSPDIHKATFSVMDHIEFLLYNCWAIDPLFVSQAASLGKYVPQTGLEEAQPFGSMITEIVSCLEEKLINKSQSFLDKRLGLLFLLNNSNFIREWLQDCSLSCIKDHLAALISFITRKVEDYTESYIQVSWAPMLSCLFNPTPLCLWRNHSPLSKFESEFQNTYTTQKLWKVPDPELRKRLRKVVIQKIIPEYTRFIEDCKVTNPNFTPQELEEMLQELFEG